MPRAHRHFLPDLIWHITHRCHGREFLLERACDRRRWRGWLFEARKRFGLCVLDYIVTSNHVHLLVHDRGRGEISKSMQLVAGRTAQQYNRRRRRRGAFWEDRYSATAVDTDEHLLRCVVYIDLNMVRAGVVDHPREWDFGGYREIQNPPDRYRIVDLAALGSLLGMDSLQDLQGTHERQILMALEERPATRQSAWSESLAIGSRGFVERVRRNLRTTGRHRRVREDGARHRLGEPVVAYGTETAARMFPTGEASQAPG